MLAFGCEGISKGFGGVPMPRSIDASFRKGRVGGRAGELIAAARYLHHRRGTSGRLRDASGDNAFQ
jgi:hypothetical protein